MSKRQVVYEVIRRKGDKVYDDFYFNSMKAANKWAEGGRKLGFSCEIANWPVMTIDDI